MRLSPEALRTNLRAFSIDREEKVLPLKFGIMTRNRDSWSSTQLQEALARHGVSSFCFSFQRLLARVGYEPYMYADGVSILDDLDALLIRPIGRGSLEEIIFRMNMLRRLQRLGLYVINPPEAVEHCADKYNILAVLEEKGIPVPRTAVTENANDALKAFHELGGDVVVKPVFGSRGVGLTRITDQDIATTIFRTITFYHGVIYLQEFVHHGSYDLRVFVIGGHVEAAMKRVANTWKTNYSQRCPAGFGRD